MSKYFLQIRRAITQLLNAILGGNADIHFSSRCYMAWHDNKSWGLVAKPVVNMLMFWHNAEDHCKVSLENDIKSMKRNIKSLEKYIDPDIQPLTTGDKPPIGGGGTIGGG